MDSPHAASRAHHGPRVEDDALVRGAGRFIADRPEPGQLHACFVRSPHAFARIRAIDIGAARGAPGVRAVLTAADMDAAGIRRSSAAAAGSSSSRTGPRSPASGSCMSASRSRW
jgi:carbon-monoxide dehydrogenase large subunit